MKIFKCANDLEAKVGEVKAKLLYLWKDPHRLPLLCCSPHLRKLSYLFHWAGRWTQVRVVARLLSSSESPVPARFPVHTMHQDRWCLDCSDGWAVLLPLSTAVFHYSRLIYVKEEEWLHQEVDFQGIKSKRMLMKFRHVSLANLRSKVIAKLIPCHS